jgi:hypothetical protein
MPNVVTIDGLTEQERAFVEAFGLGLNMTQAATRAGYAHPHTRANELMKKPAIQAAIAEQRVRFEELADVSRKDVVEGIRESIDMARLLSDPQTMIVGWRELAKICGYYEPTKHKIEMTVNGSVRLEQLASMSDAELAKIIEGEASHEPND